MSSFLGLCRQELFVVAKIAAPTCYLLTSYVIFGFAPIGARMVVKRYFLKKFVKISKKRKEKISLIKNLCSYTWGYGVDNKQIFNPPKLCKKLKIQRICLLAPGVQIREKLSTVYPFSFLKYRIFLFSVFLYILWFYGYLMNNLCQLFTMHSYSKTSLNSKPVEFLWYLLPFLE